MIRLRQMAAWGFMGCSALTITPLGCANSIREAPIRYRAQHQDDTHFLSDITVERFQECTEIYGEQLGPLDPPFSHAKAHVQVSPEGQVVDVQLTGIPDRAPDLAACTRITLRQMTVPASVLSLRQKQTADSANEQTVRRGNEIGNPIVAWEIGVLLAEFVAEHGGRIVLYTVTIEVLTAAAVAATQELIKSRRKKKPKDKCTDEFEKCTDTDLGDESGNNWNQTRCGLCLDWCNRPDSKGSWPTQTDTMSCEYWKRTWPRPN